MGKPCIIADCDNVVSDKSRLDACETCRASINRWQKRSNAEIYARRVTLNKYAARMEPLASEDVEKIPKKQQSSKLHDDSVTHVTKALITSKKKFGKSL